MDFQVTIHSGRVLDLPDEERADLMEREWVRGRELHEQGILRRLWKIDGLVGNVGLWSALDADELDTALRSLPVWPLVTVEITPLAQHPLFAEIDRDGPGEGSEP